ncbi:MAG: GDP-mannose 4,6-dehydratase [Caldilineaceae bacterium]
MSEYEIDAIYHLAALLSTSSEFTPEMAHQVNVEGMLTLLQLAGEQSQWRQRPVQFIFPSSIAVYGLPERSSKGLYQQVREWEWNQPRTMYGCNKLYCEMLGNYYDHYYRQLAAEQPVTVDFRSVRFPGLISAFTVPTGGTSDYAPEMIHAAARGEPYAASSARRRASRSWPCPTRPPHWSNWRAPRANIGAVGLQRHEL